MPVEVERENGAARVQVVGPIDRSVSDRLAPVLAAQIAGGVRSLRIELDRLTSFDSVGLADLVAAVNSARRAGAEVTVAGAPGSLREALSVIPPAALFPAEAPAPVRDRLAGLVRGIEGVAAAAKTHALVLVDLVYYSTAGPLRGERPKVRRVGGELARAGLDAFPIVSLISLLMGAILALQAAAQLRQFGATIFIADLVGVAMTREIGPLLTAILVAGRSGSANAAELGTMVVSEEVDALRQMGLSPSRYLVIPKVYALALAVPGLALVADVVGIAGGVLLSAFALGLPIGRYLEQTRQALVVSDLTTGIAKSIAFGTIVGIVGCAQGLGVRGGAEGVARATTSAVVLSIFLVIAADTVFTFLFRGF
jgi:phospholipid/cholesterol/gamma-HCH transport system permease protein